MYKPKYNAVSQMKGNKKVGLAHSNSVAKMTDPIDPKTGEKKAKEEAKQKALEARKKAGPNLGGSDNVRTFTGEAEYTIPGKKVERFAKTPEEIAAWKKASEKSKAKYRDQTKTVVETVSDRGLDKKQPSVVEKDRTPHFYYGSNEHNMNFGGHSTYGRSVGQPVGDASYTVSPSNPMSGKPNIFKSRPATEREQKLMNSRFFSSTANPYEVSEEQWNTYLNNVEARESKIQAEYAKRKQKKAKS